MEKNEIGILVTKKFKGKVGIEFLEWNHNLKIPVSHMNHHQKFPPEQVLNQMDRITPSVHVS